MLNVVIAGAKRQRCSHNSLSCHPCLWSLCDINFPVMNHIVSLSPSFPLPSVCVWWMEVTCVAYFACAGAVCRDLLKCFTTPELIQWKLLCQNFEAELKTGSAASPPTHVFNLKQENGVKRWADLKSRVVEHVSLDYIDVHVPTRHSGWIFFLK